MSCVCHLVPRGKRCMFCWAEAGYPGAKNGDSGAVKVLAYVAAYCTDCGAVVATGQRCKPCATRINFSKRWEQRQREKRAPLRERYLSKVGA